MINKDIWKDQAEFNQQLRSLPTTYEERVNLTKEFSLHMTTEITEMLEACGIWQMHRQRSEGTYNNPENVRRQLIDQFKYWMSIAQLWGFTAEDMERTYWRKSATVRQRFVEEHIHQIRNQEIVVLDLDNVLCDYTKGFGEWIMENLHTYNLDGEVWDVVWPKIQQAMTHRRYMNHTELGFGLVTWNRIQHDFRISGAMAELPAMRGASAFVQKLHDQGFVVVGLTSRPIDEYPNLHDDTVFWCADNGIVLDFIWWGADKAEKLAKNLPTLPNIRFVIDDDLRYIKQYMQMGVKTIYWYLQGYGVAFDPTNTNVIPITKLDDIKEIP